MLTFCCVLTALSGVVSLLDLVRESEEKTKAKGPVKNLILAAMFVALSAIGFYSLIILYSTNH